MDGNLFAKLNVFQTWIWFHHSTSHSRIISSTSSSLSLLHTQRSYPGSASLRYHVCRVSVLCVQRATVCRWVVLLMRATPGLPTVWALVCRWCPCWDPSSVSSYAQAGWHGRQSANPSAAAADCAASCAGSEAVLCTRATIITRAIAITSLGRIHVSWTSVDLRSTVSHRTPSICARAHTLPQSLFTHTEPLINNSDSPLFVRNASHVAPSCANSSNSPRTFLSV